MSANRRIARHPDDAVFHAFQAGWHKGHSTLYLAQARSYTFLRTAVRRQLVRYARDHWHEYLKWSGRLPLNEPAADDLVPVLKASIIDLAERRAAKELTP